MSNANSVHTHHQVKDTNTTITLAMKSWALVCSARIRMAHTPSHRAAQVGFTAGCKCRHAWPTYTGIDTAHEVRHTRSHIAIVISSVFLCGSKTLQAYHNHTVSTVHAGWNNHHCCSCSCTHHAATCCCVMLSDIGLHPASSGVMVVSCMGKRTTCEPHLSHCCMSLLCWLTWRHSCRHAHLRSG